VALGQLVPLNVFTLRGLVFQVVQNWLLVRPTKFFVFFSILRTEQFSVSSSVTYQQSLGPLILPSKGLFHHSDNVLLLLRHHGHGSWFAVLADVYLPEKQNKTKHKKGGTKR